MMGKYTEEFDKYCRQVDKAEPMKNYKMETAVLDLLSGQVLTFNEAAQIFRDAEMVLASTHSYCLDEAKIKLIPFNDSV
jgi:hypothetical protein